MNFLSNVVFLVIFIFGVRSVIARPTSSVEDQCTQVIRKHYSEFRREIVLNPSCLKGKLSWSYPNGDLALTLRQPSPSPFYLCLQVRLQMSGLTLLDASDGEDVPPIQINVQPDELACIPSNPGDEVKVILRGPLTPRSYLSIIRYQVLSDLPESTDVRVV